MTPRQRLVATVGTVAASLLVMVVPRFEGTEYRAYKDPVGILTVCSGDTKGVQLGKVYSQQECEQRLDERLVEHYQAIARCITVPISDQQKAAFTSFAYNVGADAFCRSTLLRRLNAGDYAGACAELSRWVKAGGKPDPLPGLVTRRAEERRLCEAQS